MPKCDHCHQELHRDSGGWWVGADETAECPKDSDASAPGHEVNGSAR